MRFVGLIYTYTLYLSSPGTEQSCRCIQAREFLPTSCRMHRLRANREGKNEAEDLCALSRFLVRRRTVSRHRKFCRVMQELLSNAAHRRNDAKEKGRDGLGTGKGRKWSLSVRAKYEK